MESSYKREAVEEVPDYENITPGLSGELIIERRPENTVELKVNSFKYDFLGEDSTSIVVSREKLINALHRI